MPKPQSFIVGRQSEVQRFAALVEGESNHWLLNIYGPGGIGKTVVCNKLIAYAEQNELPIAAVDGNRPDLTPDRILYSVKEGVAKNEKLADAFDDFERQFQDYLVVQEILLRGGGIQQLFNVVGSIKEPTNFTQLISALGESPSAHVRGIIRNRFAMQRYLRDVEKNLTASLSDGLQDAQERFGRSLALLFDTYEEMEGLDDWVCRTLAPALPNGVKVVIFGRNDLFKVNFDWGEFGAGVHPMKLPELAEKEAKHYLAHYGLADSVARDQVYRFTGGYPLLLVLVVHLAREAQGWANIGALESEADRDRVATKLLERILREERAREVRDFLEKGVVARWFDPEIIRVILEISLPEARAIYEKLARHSFVERHPYGLKFHDKIRELLLVRLEFTSQSEHDRIVKRLMDYYAGEAGIQSDETEKQSESAGAKYEIHIHNSQGIGIGDMSRVISSLPVSEDNGVNK